MSLKHGILGLLGYGPQSGWDLVGHFEGSLGHFWKAQTSQVYRELGTLEKNGWITGDRVVQEGRPNKQIWTLTPDGRAELVRWLTTYGPDEATEIRSSLLVRLFFSARIDRTATETLLKAYAEACRRSLEDLAGAEETARLQAGRPGMPAADPVYWQLTLLYGRHAYAASIAWAEECLVLIRREVNP